MRIALRWSLPCSAVITRLIIVLSSCLFCTWSSGAVGKFFLLILLLFLPLNVLFRPIILVHTPLLFAAKGSPHFRTPWRHLEVPESRYRSGACGQASAGTEALPDTILRKRTAMIINHTRTASQLCNSAQTAPHPTNVGMIMAIPIPIFLARSIDSLRKLGCRTACMMCPSSFYCGYPLLIAYHHNEESSS